MLFSPVPMHIPDGFLSVVVALIYWALALGVLAYAMRQVDATLGERQVPLMGVLAACIFAGQMLNFTVAGGTSGHLMGAALATIVLGPWPAMVVLACVVGVQALVFQDGGLLTLGANLFNMAIVGVAVAYFAHRTAQRLFGARSWGDYAAGIIAGWLSLFVAAISCALQLVLSGRTAPALAFPAMAGIHALIGVGEGLITAGALAFLRNARLDRGSRTATSPAAAVRNERVVWMGGLALALLLTVLAPWASVHPDGLEWVAEQQGFLTAATAAPYTLIPDYVLPGIPNESLATILAGIVGVFIVVGAALLAARVRRAAPEA